MKAKLTFRKVFKIVIGIAVWLRIGIGAPGNSTAGLVYDVSFDRTTYSVAPGATAEVIINLTETATNGESTVLGDSNNGLLSFGIIASLTNEADSSMIGSENDVFINALFDEQDKLVDSNQAFITGLAFDTTPTGTMIAPNTYQIELARIFVTASSVNGNVTDLGLADIDTSFDDFTLGDGTVLDELLDFGSATIVTSSIPEPNSLLLMGLGLAAFSTRRRREKQKLATGIHAKTTLLIFCVITGFSSQLAVAQGPKNKPGLVSVSSTVDAKYLRELRGHNDGQVVLMHESDQFFIANYGADHIPRPSDRLNGGPLRPGSLTGIYRFYLFNFNPPAGSGDSKNQIGHATFTQPIEGVVFANVEADDGLTKRYQVKYPTREGNLEIGNNNRKTRDSIWFSADLRTIFFDLNCLRETGLDRLRVITAAGPKPYVLSNATGGTTVVNGSDVTIPPTVNGLPSLAKNGYMQKNIVFMMHKVAVRIRPNQLKGIANFSASGTGSSLPLAIDTYIDAILITSDTEANDRSSNRPKAKAEYVLNAPIMAIATDKNDIQLWQSLLGLHGYVFPSGTTYDDDLELGSDALNGDKLTFAADRRSFVAEFGTISRLDRFWFIVETPYELTPTTIQFTGTNIPENLKGAFAGSFGNVNSPLKDLGYKLELDEMTLLGTDAQKFEITGSLSNQNLQLKLKPGVSLDFEKQNLFQIPLRIRGVWRSPDGRSAYQINSQQTLTVRVEDFVEGVEVVVNSGQIQRSRVDSFEVHFDKPVAHNGSGFYVRNSKNETASVDIAAGPNGKSYFLSIPETGNLIEHGSLEDDLDYKLWFRPSRFSGRRFDLNQDGRADTDHAISSFHRRFGDTTPDQRVSAEEKEDFIKSYRSRLGDVRYRTEFDFNQDQRIDARDFLQFRIRYREDN